MVHTQHAGANILFQLSPLRSGVRGDLLRLRLVCKLLLTGFYSAGGATCLAHSIVELTNSLDQ